MAISKRTRFEVLRRDSYTCRYCGASAPDVKLHVDHVIPVALGGSDKPGNLAAACADCNAGKSSTSPDDETVADVSHDALTWAQAMILAGEQLNALTDDQEDYIDEFASLWDTFRSGDKPVPVPPNWRSIIKGYHASHFPIEALTESVNIAMSRDGIALSDRFQYFCGVVRNKLNDQMAHAALLIERGDV